RSHEFLVATTRRDRSHPGRSVLATEIDVFLRHSYWRLQRLLCGRIPRSEFFLYSKTLPEGELEINPDIATAYQSVINLRVQSTGVQRSSTERTTALLVSQDWSANGSYPEEAEADFLPRVVAAFNVLGFAVIVKPHPRERPQRYDNLVASGQCTLADHAQCVEHLFATLSTNDIVVGDSSSSLASAVSLFDRSAYSFGTFLSQRYPALPYHVTAQEDFRQLTGRFVLPIETIVGFSDAFEQSDPRDE
ncbi:MAG: polysialyltransferase family glycosyltransferase, partial [Planctomycetota bacterium]